MFWVSPFLFSFLWILLSKTAELMDPYYMKGWIRWRSSYTFLILVTQVFLQQQFWRNSINFSLCMISYNKLARNAWTIGFGRVFSIFSVILKVTFSQDYLFKENPELTVEYEPECFTITYSYLMHQNLFLKPLIHGEKYG